MPNANCFEAKKSDIQKRLWSTHKTEEVDVLQFRTNYLLRTVIKNSLSKRSISGRQTKGWPAFKEKAVVHLSLQISQTMAVNTKEKYLNNFLRPLFSQHIKGLGNMLLCEPYVRYYTEYCLH